MKKWLVLILASLIVGVGALIAGNPGDAVSPPPANQIVSDLSQTDMLRDDAVMLDQMRSSQSSHMSDMVGQNPMWADPDMIRLQEQNQAELDRMIAKRP